MTEPRAYHHGHLRTALVEAGLAILQRDGLGGLSLRACAEQVGVSHMAPKNHFGNVTGLRSAIAAEGFVMLRHEMTRGLPADAGRDERRLAAFRGYVAFARANPALFEMMFSRRWVDFADPTLKGPMGETAQLLREVSAGMIWEGKAGPDADLRAEMLNWCLVHGFAQLTIQGVFEKEKLRAFEIDDILPNLPYRA